MKVLFAAAEVAPFCRTGGLGDVVGSLPQAIAEGGQAEVATMLPLHRAARLKLEERGAELRETGVELAVPLAGRVQGGRVLELVDESPLRTFFVDAPRFFERDGLYGHGDDALRYAFFSRAVLQSAEALLGGPPDVLHAHDWMSALVPIYLQSRHPIAGTKSVFTIHNLAFQGVFPKELLEALDLGWDLFRFDHLEFYDQINLMKGAITACDAVTTVSPTYAREILTGPFGQNLDGHLRAHAHKLHGIVNGLDLADWDPATDPALPAPYSAADLTGKASCRAALLDAFGLQADAGQPVVAVLSRFSEQKGLDLVCEVVPRLVEAGARLAVLGTGDRWLEQRFEELAAQFPGRVGTKIAFDDGLARRLLAGSDLLLMPSRFEPCGLTQLQAMRYGTIPVVHATGGLHDTVEDPGEAEFGEQGTGFRFDGATADGLWWALDRALTLHRAPAAWAALRSRAMQRDSSWGPSAEAYVQLYGRLLD